LYKKEELTKDEKFKTVLTSENQVFNIKLFDNKYNFLNGAVIVCAEESKLNTLKRMFQDLVENTRPEYSK